MTAAPVERIAVGTLVDNLGMGAHGTLLVLLALPNLIPVPIVPASTTITGALIILVALQLAAGRRKLWLPHSVRAYELPRDVLVGWLERARIPVAGLTSADGVPDARAIDGGASPMVLAAVGLVASLHGLVLALPIPFANLIPALAVAAFGCGLARRDPRWLAAGAALTAVAILVFVGLLRWLF